MNIFAVTNLRFRLVKIEAWLFLYGLLFAMDRLVFEARKELYSINPKCLMFGTDLPSTRSPRSYHDSDIKLLAEAFESEAVNNILCKNALEFYKI